MADHGPPTGGNDPLGDRLRSTFAAERADIERRLGAAEPATSWWKASTAWIPLTVAAAALIVAGFAFFGTRSNDDAVTVDFAAQQGETDWEVPQPEVPGSTPSGGPTPVPLPANALPPGGVFADVIPTMSGQNFCGDRWDPSLVIAWQASGEPVPAQGQAEATGQGFVTRQIPVGTRLTPVPGGCTSGATSLGPMQWHEIEGAPGQPSEWINAQYLISEAAYAQWLADGTSPPASPRPLDIGTPVAVPVPGSPDQSGFNNCGGSAAVFPLKFVWNIATDDPDGGLVAHTEPGIDAPVTRILELDEVVVVTGQCELSSTGSAWVQLRAPDSSLDWVSANFISEVGPVCMRGEQFGTRAREDESLTYELAVGDTLGFIAQRFGITLDQLLAANRHLDLTSLQIGDRLWIPGLPAEPQRIVGPVDGLAAFDRDWVAFAPTDSQTYRWYPASAVVVGLCSDPFDATTGQEPFFHTVAEGDRLGSIAAMYNVTVDVILRANPQLDPNILIHGQRLLIPGAATNNGDSFADVACNALDSEVVAGTAERGSDASTADHVHNLRAERGNSHVGPCTRIVIEFGQEINGRDVAVDLLPLMQIDKAQDSTSITLPSGMFAGFDDPSRLDFGTGIALMTTAGPESAVEVLYNQPGPVNVWFLENPARVIIDYVSPPPLPGDLASGPFGAQFVLRQPLQPHLTGRGILQGQVVTVEGFGRPFESQGSFRIYQVEPDVDPISYLNSDPEPLIDGFLPFTGWIDGYGKFNVDLPTLDPGTYIALFGEAPPADDGIQFIGAGQLFRVADPNTSLDSYPPAQLLTNVVIGS